MVQLLSAINLHICHSWILFLNHIGTICIFSPFTLSISTQLLYNILFTKEFRRVKSKKGQGLTEDKLEKRVLGLIVLRGDSVVSLTIEGPPPADDNEK